MIKSEMAVVVTDRLPEGCGFASIGCQFPRYYIALQCGS